MKNHKYISSIGMEYYWFACMYIRMQEQTGTLPPYALVQTTQTHITENEFTELEARNVLKEITYREFVLAYERAQVIMDSMVTFPSTSPRHSKIILK